ncbi:endonuclease domain-containing protein [Demequina mangrovi]|uniref:endonuclease domain-containing protein n=1 Tax=Demequina mangrovi TaxID=1043493 RepID=UPI00115F8A60|nr:hypothetical protein [Demequina mangrovi]
MASERAIADAVRAGRIVRVLPDAYASSVHAESWVLRMQAALLWAGPSTVAAGSSALAAWGALAPPPNVSISVPWETRPRGPAWVSVRRHVHMPERCWPPRRIPTVPPPLAVIQAHGELPSSRRAEAVYAPVREGIVTVAEIAETLAAMPRARGRRELERRLVAAEAGAESYLEEEAGTRVLRGVPFAHLLRQHWVHVDGTSYRLDTFDPATLTAFEFDGADAHSGPAARQRDAARDARIASVGILTVRFTYADVTDRPEWCRTIALGVLATRSQHPEVQMDVPPVADPPEKAW